MMDEINRDNCRILLAAFIEENDLTVGRVAKAIGCSEATLVRILAERSWPSGEMLKRVGIMFELGFPAYARLSEAQKERISEKIGTVGGGILGFGSISAAISSFGAVGGLSAAGVTSGLAALGSLIGGGMVAGVAVAGAIPLAAGTAGYAIIKGIKYLAAEWQLNVTERDERWEIPIATDTGEA